MGLSDLKPTYKKVKPADLKLIIKDDCARNFLLRMITYSPKKRATAE